MAQVLTPGGYRDAAKVTRVAADTFALQGEAATARLERKTPRRAAGNGGPAFPMRTTRPLGRELLVHADNGWIVYAGWRNGGGALVTAFTACWQVPPPPRTAADQTIFLFSGLQDDNWILQPVLQWGVSAVGGGPFWSVGSWFVQAGTNSPAYHSDLLQVAPGQMLTGLMTAEPSTVDGAFDYSAEFVGLAETRLDVPAVNPLGWCNLALEAYRMTGRGSYPDTAATTMSGIELRAGGTVLAPRWQPTNRITTCGQNCSPSPDPQDGPDVVLRY